MPTGYTAAIKDGISFEQFVMRCSRAMGALIMMRDEPSDAPIPERFEPSTYHVEHLDEARARLHHLHSLQAEEAEEAAEKDFARELEEHKKRIAEATQLRSQYESMLEQVKRWIPPTADHDGLKTFMIDQISSSINFDCNVSYYLERPPVRLSGEEWRSTKVLKALQDISYHQQQQANEIRRTTDRNLWLHALRASLKVTA